MFKQELCLTANYNHALRRDKGDWGNSDVPPKYELIVNVKKENSLRLSITIVNEQKASWSLPLKVLASCQVPSRQNFPVQERILRSNWCQRTFECVTTWRFRPPQRLPDQKTQRKKCSTVVIAILPGIFIIQVTSTPILYRFWEVHPNKSVWQHY